MVLELGLVLWLFNVVKLRNIVYLLKSNLPFYITKQLLSMIVKKILFTLK